MARRCQNLLKTRTDMGHPLLDPSACHLGKQQQPGLAGVSGQAGDTMEPHGAAGDRRQACLRLRQADIPTPPVVNPRQGRARTGYRAPVDAGCSRPSPVVLQLVAAGLAIGPIPPVSG